MNKRQFKYWLRINGFRPEQFGTGTKWNPIRLSSRKSLAIKCGLVISILIGIWIAKRITHKT